MATLAISPFPVRGWSILEKTVAHDLKPQKGKKKGTRDVVLDG
jgi:hypothetical protein